MVIVYFGTKGGGGKTSLSVSHAGWLVDQGYEPPAFLDVDVQKLASRWLMTAEPRIVVREATTPAEVEKGLRSLRAQHSIVVADGPGGFDKQNIVLLRRADLIVVPVMASPLDIHSALAGARELINVVKAKYQVSPKVRFVVNGLDDRTRFSKEMRSFQCKMDPPATEAAVRRLTALIRSAAQGVIPTRMRKERKAIQDLDALFRELMSLVSFEHARKAGNG